MTIQLKRNDTKDTISYKLTNADNTAVDLTGASVRFVMGRGNVLITNAEAVIADAATGEVEYALTDSDTLTAGMFHAEFEVTFSDGKIKTYPNNGYIIVNIQANVDSDKSTYVEDAIALRVSDIEVFKNDVNAKVTQAQEDAAKVNDFENRIDNIVAQAGTDNTEIVDARLRSDNTVAPTLGSHVRELSSQLAETGKQATVMTNLRNQTQTGACITFIDDDATSQVWDVLRPFIVELNIPYVLAVPPGAREMFPTMISLEQLKIMQDEYNCEIAAHSMTHPSFQNLTEDQKVYEFTESKKILTQAGLNVKNFVYPFGSGFEESTQKLCTQYFNCGVSASGGLNTKPVRSMDLGRIAIGSYLEGNNDGSYNYYKSKIDEAISKNGWLIFMTHVNMPSHTAEVYQVMRDIVTYARANNVSIVNLQDGYERFGNIVEIPGKLTIQNDGEIVKPNFNNVLLPSSTGITSTTPLTSFAKNKVSINYFSLANNTGFPSSNAGTLETYYINDSSTSYQIWRPFIDAGQIVTSYYRRATSDTTWGSFRRTLIGDRISVEAIIGTVAAGTTVVADITVSNISNTCNINVSPGFNLASELQYSIRRVNASLLRLAVYNPTAASVTVTPTTWQISIID